MPRKGGLEAADRGRCPFALGISGDVTMSQNDHSKSAVQEAYDPNEPTVQENPLVKVFGKETKTEILWAIIDSSSTLMSVSDIAEYTDLSRGAVNRNIIEPVEMGILEQDDIGRGRAFALAETSITDAISELKEIDEEAFREILSDSPKLKILAAMRFAKHGLTDAATLVDLTGLGQTTVYRHLPELQERGVIVESESINGTQTYALNKRDKFCQQLFQLDHKLNFAMPEPVAPDPPRV